DSATDRPRAGVGRPPVETAREGVDSASLMQSAQQNAVPGRSRARLVATLALVASLLCAALLLAGQTVRSMLRLEAASGAQRGGAGLAGGLPALGAIAGGAAPADDSRAMLDLSRRIGTVYRYRLHLPDGTVGASGGFPAGSATPAPIGEREPRATAAMLAGQSFVRLVEGDGFREPGLRAEVFVPIRQGDRLLALAEV